MYILQNKVANRNSKTEVVYSCCDCGKEVKMTMGELFFYDDKNLVVPKRCKECKDIKNEKIKEENAAK